MLCCGYIGFELLIMLFIIIISSIFAYLMSLVLMMITLICVNRSSIFLFMFDVNIVFMVFEIFELVQTYCYFLMTFMMLFSTCEKDCFDFNFIRYNREEKMML